MPSNVTAKCAKNAEKVSKQENYDWRSWLWYDSFLAIKTILLHINLFIIKARKRDMKHPRWYHFDCIFKSKPIKSADHIEHFEEIEYSDQVKIMEKIDPNFKNGEIARKKIAETDKTKAITNYGVECMPELSDRGNCSTCGIEFWANDLIVMRIVFDSRVARRHGRDIKWNHLVCFAEKRGYLRYDLCGRDLPGFDKLDRDDQALVNAILP